MVAITTDHPVSQIQTLPLCAGLAVKAGLPMEEGFRAITIYPAKICGVATALAAWKWGKMQTLPFSTETYGNFHTNPLYYYQRGDRVL